MKPLSFGSDEPDELDPLEDDVEAGGVVGVAAVKLLALWSIPLGDDGDAAESTVGLEVETPEVEPIVFMMSLPFG